MAAVILFILLCIGLYFLYVYFKKDAEKMDHYRELAFFFSERELGLLRTSRNDKRNTDDIICKFFKEHPDKLAEAERKFKEREKRSHEYDEYRKKELIKSRVFAYDYEDMLFQIFAPTAKDINNHWSPGNLSKEHVVMRIAGIRNVSKEEALRICDILINKEVLYDISGAGLILAPMFYDDFSCRPDSKWNIVSDTDMTLNKWMVAHGYKHNKEI